MFTPRTKLSVVSGAYFAENPAAVILEWADRVASMPVSTTIRGHKDRLFIGMFLVLLPIQGVLSWVFSMLSAPNTALKILFIGVALIMVLGAYSIVEIKTETFRHNFKVVKDIAQRIAFYRDQVSRIDPNELNQWIAKTQRGIWTDLL